MKCYKSMPKIASVFGTSLLMASVILPKSAGAQEYVHGYMRSNGTYVAPHYRSAPDDTVTNNYSYSGNVNPFTGREGEDYYTHDETSPYYEGPDSEGDSGHDGY